MGSGVIASCECGFNDTFMIGGGMLDFKTTCLFPCLCERCQTIVSVNLLTKKNRCPECRSTRVIPYDDPSLSEKPGKHVVATWNMAEELGRMLKLTNGKYKCPQCGKMALRFSEGGLCWD